MNSNQDKKPECQEDDILLDDKPAELKSELETDQNEISFDLEGDERALETQAVNAAFLSMELPPGWEFDVFEGDLEQAGLRKRRSNRLLPGIPLQLIEEDRRARELMQKRKRKKQDSSAAGLKRSYSTVRNGKLPREEEVDAHGTGSDSEEEEEPQMNAQIETPVVKEEVGGRHTLTSRRLKRRRVSKRKENGLEGEHEGLDADDDCMTAETFAEEAKGLPQQVEEPKVAEEEHEKTDAPDDQDANGMSVSLVEANTEKRDDEQLALNKEETAITEADSGEDTPQAQDDSSNSAHAEDEGGDDGDEGEDSTGKKRKRQAGEERRKYRKKSSFHDRRELWDQLWEEKFQELVKWRNEKGACSVGKNDNNKTLAWWIHEQRRKKRHGTLSDYRLEKLNSIGFVWSVDGEGRGGHRRRKKDEAKDDSDEYKPELPAISSVDEPPKNLMPTIFVIPPKGAKTTKAKRGRTGKGRGGRTRNGGNRSASIATSVVELKEGDGYTEERVDLEETTVPVPKRKGKTGKFKVECSPKDEQPMDAARDHIHHAPLPVPPALPSFYEMFLRREEERRRDKEAMDAMLARIQKEREQDKKRIARLEEIVRTFPLNSQCNGHINSHMGGHNGLPSTSARNVERSVTQSLSSSTPAVSFVASHSFVTNGYLPEHLPTHTYPASRPAAPSVPHHASTPSHLPSPMPLHSTALPSMIPTAIEAMTWKIEPRQDHQQRSKGSQHENEAKVRSEVEQLMEESKILPNVEELEIDEFFA